MRPFDIATALAIAFAAGYLVARSIFGPPGLPGLMVVGFLMMCVGFACTVATRTMARPRR